MEKETKVQEIDWFIASLIEEYITYSPVSDTQMSYFFETGQDLPANEALNLVVEDFTETVLGFLYCILEGHDYQDDGGGNPESGKISMTCSRCSAGFSAYWN